jgi:AraC family transcriptional regulator of adaptative response / DNA-3-methyladenine glycosylase II
MILDTEACHAAIEARDPRFDGLFFVGVTSTNIYCRCVCTAKTPKPANRTFHLSAAAAEKAGFRPCLLCRPELAPGMAPIDAPARLASQALARIEAGALEEEGIEEIAAELGVTGRHLRRVMADTFGASPIEIAQTHRLLMAKRLLRETDLTITQVAFAAGFRSVRRFNAIVRERYRLTPQKLRGRQTEKRDQLKLLLTARGDYRAAPVFEFMARRALPGVEVATRERYARTLTIGGVSGWIDVRPQGRGLSLTLSDTLAPALRPLVAAVRGAFDLDVDSEAIDAHVGFGDGVRIAGGLDGFEIAGRAVLGQQVTLSAACTLAGKLATKFGAPLGDAPEGLSLLFPSAKAVAVAGPAAIAAIGMPMQRAQTLHRIAEASASGALKLERGAIASGRAGLAKISGVGPWTIEYIALRALGDPDAFPSGDAVLRAQLREANTESWRPWRGYAAVRLWARASDEAAFNAAKTKTQKTRRGLRP